MPKAYTDEERLYRIFLNTEAVGDCLEWQGAKLSTRWNDNHSQYGRIKVLGKEWLVHRWVFVYLNKWEPEAVMHTCDNPSCIAPWHLTGGTRQGNIADMDSKRRRSITRSEFCKQGHNDWVEYNRSMNTNMKTSRYCRECRRSK
jgi:hypothetical protein